MFGGVGGAGLLTTGGRDVTSTLGFAVGFPIGGTVIGGTVVGCTVVDGRVVDVVAPGKVLEDALGAGVVVVACTVVT